MQIVIDIPDDLYDKIQKEVYGTYSLDASELYRAVQQKSTVLPKGHGRLIDADALPIEDLGIANGVTEGNIDNAHTVLEADNSLDFLNMRDKEHELEEQMEYEANTYDMEFFDRYEPTYELEDDRM